MFYLHKVLRCNESKNNFNFLTGWLWTPHTKMSDEYVLYYWPLAGRGEFVKFSAA